MSHEIEIAKQFINNDENTRLTIYYDYNAENPRFMTDFPLHCEDWSRDYSIMSREEHEYKSSNAMCLLQELLKKYGNQKKIINLLKSNYKDEPSNYINCLSYDMKYREWNLDMWQPAGIAYQGCLKESEWETQKSWYGSIKNIDFYELIDELSDATINFLIDNNCFTDDIRIMSYDFDYNGSFSFHSTFDCDSIGIAYLLKNEYIKYTGRKDKWKEIKECYNLARGMMEDIEAWSNNEVFGFVLEKKKTYHITKKCTSEEESTQDYDIEEWEELDSCWGYYGDMLYCIHSAVTAEEFENMYEINK